jgi:polyphosphate kinase
MLDVNLTAADYYLNRELSLLDFNRRVLAQARDTSLPLLERLRFLCISCSNLDEFFEIRVAGLKQRRELGSAPSSADCRSVDEQLQAIRTQAAALISEQYELLNQVVLPELDTRGIRFANARNFTADQLEWLAEFFAQEVEPVLTPLGLDPGRPFPRIQNKSLNFLVRLSGKDAFGRDASLAVVQVPRALPRIVRLPGSESADGIAYFAFLSAVVSTFVPQLFDGMTVEGAWQFRVTRNSDLFVDDEEVDDMLRAIEGELAQRRYGAAVRLETSADCPEDLTNFLLQHFALTRDDLYQVNGPVNLNRLMAIYDLIDRPDLKYPSFTPVLPKRLTAWDDLFAAIRDGDILLHHPFHSFAPVIDFVRQAGTDRDVLAIKQTLYRAGPDSPIVDALVHAAQAGKEVTVVIELMARFDEADNIKLATRLQEAGAHVMYGVVGFKTHAKMIMVVRRERGKLRRYVHLGTGNYHPNTARAYTDYGLLSCDKAIGEDLHQLFLQLTSPTRPARLKKILQSPFTLHAALLAKIARETEHARQGKPARIVAKLNALIEPQIIRALYQASMAGVRIDLIVRSICALRPGIPGVSENIAVRSIVGRFLEHSRVYYFHNDGEREVLCSSADWMERNFFRRLEVCFPIQTPEQCDRIVADLELYLADNSQAWQLQSDGSYVRLLPNKAAPITAQTELLKQLTSEPRTEPTGVARNYSTRRRKPASFK